MDRAEEIRLQYKRLRSEYGELYDEVLQILFRNDPIGINFEVNTDEYEPEVSTILPQLTEAHSVEDLHKIIRQEFVRWFGADIAGSRAKYARIAQDVWDAYKKHAV